MQCFKPFRQCVGIRGVAQLGRALRSGRRGRGFESRHLDTRKIKGFRVSGTLDFYLGSNFVLTFSIYFLINSLLNRNRSVLLTLQNLNIQ